MKRFVVLFIVMAVMLLPVQGQELTEADDHAGEQAYAAISPQQARYEFEHRLLPTYFYDQPESVVYTIASMGMYPLWEALCIDNDVDPYYPEEEYETQLYAADGDAMILRAIFPEPDDNLLCYRVYFVYDPGSGNSAYYTVEYDNYFMEAAFLCKWNEDRNHENLGGAEILEKDAPDYEEKLQEEMERIAMMEGITGEWKLEEIADAEGDENE